MSCWWICWFFISKTSFRLFRSSSMCLYGAKASWKQLVKTSFMSWSGSRIIDHRSRITDHGSWIMDEGSRITRHSPLSAHLCSCAELLQTALLGLGGCGSGTSACPPDPSECDTHALMTALTEETCYLNKKQHFTCRDSLIFSNSSSKDFVCCSWAIFRSDTWSGWVSLSFPCSSGKNKRQKYSQTLTLDCSGMLLLQGGQSVAVSGLHLHQRGLMVLLYLLHLQPRFTQLTWTDALWDFIYNRPRFV